jgi:hypothetical protein
MFLVFKNLKRSLIDSKSVTSQKVFKKKQIAPAIFSNLCQDLFAITQPYFQNFSLYQLAIFLMLLDSVVIPSVHCIHVFARNQTLVPTFSLSSQLGYIPMLNKY